MSEDFYISNIYIDGIEINGISRNSIEVVTLMLFVHNCHTDCTYKVMILPCCKAGCGVVFCLVSCRGLMSLVFRLNSYGFTYVSLVQSPLVNILTTIGSLRHIIASVQVATEPLGK